MSTDTLSRLERLILEAVIKAPGEWLSRNQIAALIGRADGYTPNDVRALNSLADAGYIEKRERIIGIAKPIFEYRFKVVDNDA